MHKLKTLACDEARRFGDSLPDVLSATKCLCKYMQTDDWETLYSFNRALGHYPAEHIEPFRDLINWALDKQFLSELESNDPRLSKGKKMQQATRIAEQLTKLSGEIGSIFPELRESYSLLRVISPWKHAAEPYTITNKPESWRSAEGLTNLDVEGEKNIIEGPEVVFELKGSWSHVANIVRRRRCYGLETPAAGEHSVLTEIAEYMTKTIASTDPHLPRRKYPVWCRLAARELWQRINKSQFFKPASQAQKYRIIEYSVFAYAEHSNLEMPGAGWGMDQIKQSIFAD